jgi:hypothetical protein
LGEKKGKPDGLGPFIVETKTCYCSVITFFEPLSIFFEQPSLFLKNNKKVYQTPRTLP